MSDWSRRLFFSVGAGALLGTPAIGATRWAATRVVEHADSEASDAGVARVPASFPAQDPAAVREVVGKSHFDLDAVESMVAKRPALAKAAWDWGFGDWESALGAASHVGRPDIAHVLIAHGARPNLFTFAMLGQVDAVRAIVDSNPGVQRITGPHGITLLAHARNGGEAAAGVVEYLEGLGDADPRQTSLDLSEDRKSMYVGVYAYGSAADERLRITDAGAGQGAGRLAIQRGEEFGRTLLHFGDHTFHPTAAPAVRIFFKVEGDRASTLTVHDGDLVVTARRAES